MTNDEYGKTLEISHSPFVIRHSSFRRSLWRSLESSLPCHGGDRGFKSRLGRSTARYANGKAAKLKTWCLGVQLPPVLVRSQESGIRQRVGWAWASPRGCNPHAIAVQVQLLPDALGEGREKRGEGREEWDGYG